MKHNLSKSNSWLSSGELVQIKIGNWEKIVLQKFDVKTVEKLY